MSLPDHMNKERFVRTLINQINRTPKLKECSAESIIGCADQLAAVGLEADGTRAHLIPYGKTCTLIIDYKGKVELVRRNGDVVKIHCDVVCEADTFDYNMGEITAHTFDYRKARGAMQAVYAMVQFKDGSKQVAVMTKEEVEGIRKRSKSGNNGPWKTDYNEMAKKTAFHRLSKLLTLSPEIRDAFAASDNNEYRDVSPKAAPVGVRMAPTEETPAPVLETPVKDQPKSPLDNGEVVDLDNAPDLLAETMEGGNE